VIEMGCGSSKTDIAPVQSNRQNNKERNGYWKIDEHARKVCCVNE
jgi:hypothetical protein